MTEEQTCEECEHYCRAEHEGMVWHLCPLRYIDNPNKGCEWWTPKKETER